MDPNEPLLYDDDRNTPWRGSGEGLLAQVGALAKVASASGPSRWRWTVAKIIIATEVLVLDDVAP
jgi:hypothetical protein